MENENADADLSRAGPDDLRSKGAVEKGTGSGQSNLSLAKEALEKARNELRHKTTHESLSSEGYIVLALLLIEDEERQRRGEGVGQKDGEAS